MVHKVSRTSAAGEPVLHSLGVCAQLGTSCRAVCLPWETKHPANTSTNEQFGREASVMLEVEGERAKRRQVRKPSEFVVQNSSPQNEKGAARQIVADKLGSAPQKVTQACGERWAGEGIKLVTM